MLDCEACALDYGCFTLKHRAFRPPGSLAPYAKQRGGCWSCSDRAPSHWAMPSIPCVGGRRPGCGSHGYRRSTEGPLPSDPNSANGHPAARAPCKDLAVDRLSMFEIRDDCRCHHIQSTRQMMVGWLEHLNRHRDRYGLTVIILACTDVS